MAIGGSARAALAAACLAVAAVAGGCSSGPSATPPAAVKGFDAAGISVGTGDGFSAADWHIIRADGFRLFLTDPVVWSSECSDGSCSAPVGTCTIDQAAVTQLQLAAGQHIDYAIYTRNPDCLATAITALPAALRAHLSFALLDVEPGPGVPVTQALVNRVMALGQTPVIYSFPAAWRSVMHGSTGFSRLPLQDGQVANFNVAFPAPYPAGFPALVPMPVPYGGWSGPADIEQQQANAQITGPAGTLGDPSDRVDLDAVSAVWLASLPHHF